MTFSTIITFILITIALLLVGAITYVYLRNRSLEEIRGDVYQLFIKAEHRFIESSAGKQKMKWVISEARKLLPEWLQAFITDELLYIVLENWFGMIKDLLDDGKYNK